jgi:hypothetical protein
MHCYGISISFVRFEVFTAVTMKNRVFWDVPPCGSCKNRRFGGTWRLFLQEPHGVTSQKTLFFIVTAVKAPNLTNYHSLSFSLYLCTAGLM